MVLMLAFLLVAPKLIELQPIKEKVLAHISERVDGKAAFQGLDLSLFPRPHVVIHQASLSIPGKASGTLGLLNVYPKILPLLKGELQIAKLLVVAPDFKVRLPTRHRDSARANKGMVTQVLAPFSLELPDLIVDIKYGRLEFFEEDRAIFSFHNVDARVVFPPSGFKIDLTCNSNLWEKIEVKGTLDPKDFEGKAHIDLTNFRPHKLTNFLFPDALHRLAQSQVNLTFGFNFLGRKVLQAELEGSLPHLAFQRENEEVVIKGKKLKGAFRMDGDKITVSLTELNLEYPHLNMNANLLLDQGSPRVSLELEARDVDVHSTREVALSLAGDVPDIRKVFEIIRGGKVPFLTLKAQANALAELKSSKSIIVDPKQFDANSFVDFKGEVCIIPPNSFALSRTVEYFRVPRSVLTICVGKSSYARCGIIVNVTPFEPEWVGYVTLEISNTTPLPAKIYANEGIAQVLFFEADEECKVSYADKKGKYQGQQSIVLPRL